MQLGLCALLSARLLPSLTVRLSRGADSSSVSVHIFWFTFSGGSLPTLSWKPGVWVTTPICDTSHQCPAEDPEAGDMSHLGQPLAFPQSSFSFQLQQVFCIPPTGETEPPVRGAKQSCTGHTGRGMVDRRPQMANLRLKRRPSFYLLLCRGPRLGFSSNIMAYRPLQF